MSDAVLDRLELFLRDSRERNDLQPRERARKVFVDPGGRIRLGDAVPQNDGPGLSEIHQAVFA
jgi:hypothetical protein